MTFKDLRTFTTSLQSENVCEHYILPYLTDIRAKQSSKFIILKFPKLQNETLTLKLQMAILIGMFKIAVSNQIHIDSCYGYHKAIDLMARKFLKTTVECSGQAYWPHKNTGTGLIDSLGFFDQTLWFCSILGHHNAQTTNWIFNHKNTKLSKLFHNSAQLIDIVSPKNLKIILFASDDSIKDQVSNYNEKRMETLNLPSEYLCAPIVEVPMITDLGLEFEYA